MGPPDPREERRVGGTGIAGQRRLNAGISLLSTDARGRPQADRSGDVQSGTPDRMEAPNTETPDAMPAQGWTALAV